MKECYELVENTRLTWSDVWNMSLARRQWYFNEKNQEIAKKNADPNTNQASTTPRSKVFVPPGPAAQYFGGE